MIKALQPYILSFVLLFIVFNITAQKRQGNIVAYFGKEKINEIKEGKAIHVFKNGLFLSSNTSSLNSTTFPKDPVFKDFLMSPKTVSENEIAGVDRDGISQKWTRINVNDKSTFSDSKLRGSYLYLSYKSASEQNILFEASGHTTAIINGYPHEGDYYDFGYSIIPIKLKKGINVFVLKVGRFPRIRARLIKPKAAVIFTSRDQTLPDLLIDDTITYKGAIRIVNNSPNWVKNHLIKVSHQNKEIQTVVPAIPPMSVRKVVYTIPFVNRDSKEGKTSIHLSLQNKEGVDLDTNEISLQIKSKHQKHKRTFISNIDGSLQYFAVAPSSNKELKKGALFLSVHGASVEATNQANAYKQKDWGTVVAPTNRRPFGFAWEDWGRLDALEVLAEGKRIYNPDPSKIYLTGHSMGGHGSWYLGATYPDHFAAIAPCAGYPDLIGYRKSFLKRALKASKEELKRWGITPKRLAEMSKKPLLTNMDHMILRAGNPSRTLKLKRNYLQQGVYILHGEKDNVVPTFIAQEMRKDLGTFHTDFSYYEYPGGKHWYGDHSMDWPPIFDMFKRHQIKADSTITKMEFFTASPGVSASSHFISIHQQVKPLEISSFDFSNENSIDIKTNNVACFSIKMDAISSKNDSLSIDGTIFKTIKSGTQFFKKNKDNWELTTAPSLKEKGPHRNGGFKDAFRNNVVFVYASNGNTDENKWYYNKARLDAQTFYYRANGSVEIVKDSDFDLKKYPNRNIVIYGNKDNNSAWKKLLKNAAVQVRNNYVSIGDKVFKGSQWGMYFIVPRPDSDTASVGVVTASGTKGMKAIYSNHYLLNGTTYPDLQLFSDGILEYGTAAVKCAGFFGNDWSIENGDFEWQ